MDLSGKVALVTGVKRVGAVVADALAAAGADVALVFNRSRDEADAAAAEIRGRGRRASTLQADLARAGECRRVVDETAAELGRLDVLVAMASLYAHTPFEAITTEQWDTQLNVDLRSAFLCAQAAAPHLKRAGGGRIILFSDWVAASGRPRYVGYTHYYVAKAGVKALAEALALELAADQILVNAIAPGPILPPPETSAAEREEVAAATPLGRWGGESEIAKAVLHLIASEFVTGETIRVDGGRHLK